MKFSQIRRAHQRPLKEEAVAQLPHNRTPTLLRWGLRVAPAIFFIAALWLLHEEARKISAAHLWAELNEIPAAQWGLALLATAAGYAVLTFYDLLGLRMIGARLPFSAAAEGAFLSFTVSHNVGLGWISGGSMRQHVYGPKGVPLADIARLTVLNSLTFFIGAFVLTGAVLIGEPSIISPLLPIPTYMTQVAGGVLWLAVALYLALCARRRRPLGWGQISLPVPGPRTALAQIAASTADILLAATALYVLLPNALDIGFPVLLGVYLVALGVSVMTHVPGGLGVLETLILLSLPGEPRAPLLATLVAYRIVYYLIPLAVALLLVASRRLAAFGVPVKRAAMASRQWTPILAAALSLGSGMVLLFPGPMLAERVQWVRFVVPLPLLELSHLTGSIAGFALVVLASALYRRYDTARTAGTVLLLAGSVSSLLQGAGLAIAFALAAAAGVLAMSGPAFYRHGSFRRNAISPAWLALALGIVALSISVGLRSYENVAYSNDLWWQFAYDAHAPRFLRASLVLSVLGLGLLLAWLLGPAPQLHKAEEASEAIRAVIAQSPDANAHLALLGDKRFLVSASRKAFVMYQVERRSWIAMGDPIGSRADLPELLWRFRELSDAAGGRAVFYEVLGENVGLYSEVGLVAHKIGEEARVDLRSLNLDTPRSKHLRAVLRRGERDGLTFEIVPACDVPFLLGDLQRVSDDWIAAKQAREKGFSLGAFRPGYLSEFDCVVVRHEGRIVAFANIWLGGDFEAAAVDLMRHCRDAPRSTMMFLMLRVILWAQHSGACWFNLGMAPLTGLAGHRLAPVWHRMGRLIFDHGERLYGFDGLRRFKEQFGPDWRPRYIACRPGMAALATALADCASLIARPPIPSAGPVADPARQHDPDVAWIDVHGVPPIRPAVLGLAMP